MPDIPLKFSWTILLLFTVCFTCVLNIANVEKEEYESSSLDVVQEKDDRLLLFTTLDGTLTAIEQQTGRIRWKIKEKPIVQVPLDMSDAIVPVYLPDPRDGSLYLIGNIKELLKKLPFTIPQLVSSSPCRSSDGILYTGKKKDTWFKLDPNTGRKQQILGWDDHSSTCPLDTDKFIYIGRTQYNLRMVNGKKPENKWNVTFYDYTASQMSKEELSNYDMVHFTSTSTGRLVTLDRWRGTVLWDGDLGSPIIGSYLLDSEGLISIPFTSLANHTISYLITELSQKGLLENPNHMKLYPTLYIGEHSCGLYAIPSLVDQNVVTITASDSGPLLLGGPNGPGRAKMYPEFPLPGHNYRLPRDGFNNEHNNFQSLPSLGNHIIIFTGHYNVPTFSNQKLLGATKDMVLFKDESTQTQSGVCIDTRPMPEAIEEKASDEIKYDKNMHKVVVPNRFAEQYKHFRLWINQQENKGLKLSLIVMTGCVIAMFWYLQIQVREMQNLSQNGSRSNQHSSYGLNNNVTALSEELPNGLVKVGKITFHPEQLLGKGCEGTFVYRGEFDSRRVAVKRLLPECFTFADREVALLRESDAHPHVIRYYCMEQDRMFRYIALELCQATLSDYIQGKCDISPISPLEILRQATSGLCHLHSLDIVHRDIKPHNVLISVPNNRSEVRAMISDFGLCKKLQVGRGSFSRRSGVTGTDGWIAPEMLNGTERTTYAVDLFSLGCLYYYVLSKGLHPFGDALRRQANILMGNYDLSDLKGPDWLTTVQKTLISALISSKPDIRPSCQATLEHPMFWGCDKILGFFQEVSDRVEKAEASDFVLRELETDGELVVKFDWRYFIHEEVASDLKKYRSYQGDSVRDLLRALRNKTPFESLVPGSLLKLKILDEFLLDAYSVADWGCLSRSAVAASTSPPLFLVARTSGSMAKLLNAFVTKHHYRELSLEAQALLGEDAETFLNYWTSRFPLLMAHTWITMQCVADEEKFKVFYHKTHRYSLKHFKEQASAYITNNPVELPMSQEAENADNNTNNPWRPKRDLLNSPGKQIGKPENVLIKSGGLYRNHSLPENKFKPANKSNKSFVTKKNSTKKKSDEPLVWVLPKDK